MTSVDSTGVSATSTAVLGQTVDGRYRVESLLAHGGMASVYVATDTRLHRRIALKVMRPDLARDAAFVERFRREARASARMSHPNIVGVFDQGEDGDVVFLAMELVAGRTLRDLIADKAPVSVRDAVAIMDPVLAALSAAHQSGLIHRDIKPENVLIGSADVVKVADFGLARAIETSAATSTDHPSTTWGTAAYLSPEQVEHGHADARSDVYSAALMLYELLTGVKAFPGDSPLQVAFQHVHGEIPRASESNPTLPAELDALIQWAAATDPNRRPDDASRFRAALLDAVAQLSEEEYTARPGTADEDRPDDDGTAIVPRLAPPSDPRTRQRPAPDRPASQDALAGDDDGDLGAISDATRPIRPHRTRMVPIAAAHPGRYARTTGNRPSPSATSKKRTKKADRRRASSPAAGVASGGRSDRTDPFPTAAGLRRRRRRHVTGWVLGILLALVSVGGATAAWYFTVGPGVHSTTPDVIGAPVDQARADIDDLQLRPVIERVYSEDVDADLVISQSPTVGADLRHGSDVSILVSMGPERYDVPDLVGLSEDEARRAVTDANLAWAEPKEAYSDDAPIGEVTSTDPEIGSPQPPGTEVTATLSAGPEPIPVPEVVGSTQDEATTALEDADLTVTIAEDRVNHDEIPAGSVVSRDPGDETLHRGDDVTLTLSDGPELIEVPNVFAQSYTSAEAELTDLGFEVERTDISGGVFGLVRDQSVSGGEMMPRGTVIVLSVI